MSKKPTKAAPESKALTVPERAVAAIGYNAETTQELTTLAERNKHIVAITNDDGRQQANRARLDLRAARLEIVRRGKTAREDATAYSKAVIAEETKLVALVEPEEDRLAKLVDEFDASAEAEKARKVQAELDRVAALQARVEAIRQMYSLPVNPDPQYVLDTITETEAIAIDATFEEYEQQALEAKRATLFYLHEQHGLAVARIAREEQARKDAAELEALRREKAERERKDREATAQREAEEKARRDEIARVERNRLAAEAAARQPAADVGAPMSDLVHRGPPPQTSGLTPCKGASCGTTDYSKHSAECIAEHDRATTFEPEQTVEQLIRAPVPPELAAPAKMIGAEMARHVDAQLAALQQQADITPTLDDIARSLAARGISPSKPGDPHDEAVQTFDTTLPNGDTVRQVRPTLGEIIRTLAWHFETEESTVRGWLDADYAYQFNLRRSA